MRRLSDPSTLLLAALILLHLVPLWAVPFFPSQDGPTHLENAVILRDYDRPDRPILREFYTLNTHFDPNWLGHLALRGLLAFLPVLAAEKVLLSAYVLLLPLAVWYALEGVRTGAGFLAVLALPFVQNFPYHMGFHNFCFSLGVFFLVVGYWLRHREGFGPRSTIMLGVLVVLLYFCHLVAVVMALLTIGVLGLAWAICDVREKRASVMGTLAKRLLLPVAAFVPALALGAAFLGRQGTAAASRFTTGQLWDKLRHLDVLVSYLPLEGVLAEAIFWGFVVVSAGVLGACLVTRRLGRGDAFLLVVALTAAAYFLAPSSLAGGSFVNTRLSLFPFFVLILWLGTIPFGAGARRLLGAAGSLLALGFLVLHATAYAEFSDYLEEYVSAEAHLRPNATLLPLTFRRDLLAGTRGLERARVGVFRHASGYLAARAGVVELENYEATTGYFPVRFREELNPFVYLSPEGRGTDIGLQAEPPRVDIAGYARRTGKTVDFVLLWQVRPEQRDDPAARAIFRELEEGYDHVFTSRRGLLQLYRRKDLAVEGGP